MKKSVEASPADQPGANREQQIQGADVLMAGGKQPAAPKTGNLSVCNGGNLDKSTSRSLIGCDTVRSGLSPPSLVRRVTAALISRIDLAQMARIGGA